MATVTVNDTPTEIGDAKLNLIQAAKVAGVEIPHYCWHPSLSVVASCRMCLVEVGDRKPDGTIAMQPKLVPACQTPAKDGTLVITNSDKVRDAQKATLEYLLLNHPLDCPVCDQAGECFLQDYSYRFGRPQSRLQEDKLLKDDKDHIGAQITLFTDRCVMCTRCVRFTREISGTAELMVVERGSHAEIDIFPGQPCDNKLAGNVVDICPVGALCSKDFLYQQRVWFLQSKPSVCPNCSTGCSIHIDQNNQQVYRLRPRPNPRAQGDFMCDEGRFGFKYIHSPERLISPLRRQGDQQVPIGWAAGLAEVRERLAAVAKEHPDGLMAILSPWMTCEEAYLFATYIKGLSAAARLALGPVRVVGADDTYPKDARGMPREPVRFTIRAEKCPNRRGVEAVLRHFDPCFEEAPRSAGAFKAIFMVGGDREAWITPEEAAMFRNAAEILIVLDILPSPVSAVADYVLPGGSFAEQEGTFVNAQGLAQSVQWAIRTPGEARTNGRIFLDLLGRRGLWHAGDIRREMAAAIPAFSPLAGETDPMGTVLPEMAPNEN